MTKLKKYNYLNSNVLVANAASLFLPKVPDDQEALPLQWWKERAASSPTLAQLARLLLAIPASSAISERVFAKLGRLSAQGKFNTKPETAGVLESRALPARECVRLAQLI